MKKLYHNSFELILIVNDDIEKLKGISKNGDDAVILMSRFMEIIQFGYEVSVKKCLKTNINLIPIENPIDIIHNIMKIASHDYMHRGKIYIYILEFLRLLNDKYVSKMFVPLCNYVYNINLSIKHYNQYGDF